jgi:hypothetical protein
MYWRVWVLMMSDNIDLGEVVRITNGDGFQLKPDNTPFDPISVELTVRAPDGTVLDISGSVQSDSTGLYYADLVVDQADVWTFRWNGDSVIEEGAFYVRRSAVGVV